MNRSPIEHAQIVLEHAKSSAANFFTAFDTVRSSRGTGLGRPNNEEQDLLRSALVFATAGLDSLLKQLIRDALPALAKSDVSVQQEFETFVQRQLRGDEENAEGPVGHKFLARVLVSPHPHERLLEDYVFHLTGSSLQSVDQLFKTSKALGIDPKILKDKKDKLEKIFEARNKIIHELDIKFGGRPGQRHRNSRNRLEFKEYTEILEGLGDEMLKGVSEKLNIDT